MNWVIIGWSICLSPVSKPVHYQLAHWEQILAQFLSKLFREKIHIYTMLCLKYWPSCPSTCVSPQQISMVGHRIKYIQSIFLGQTSDLLLRTITKTLTTYIYYHLWGRFFWQWVNTLGYWWITVQQNIIPLAIKVKLWDVICEWIRVTARCCECVVWAKCSMDIALMFLST